MSYKPTHYIGFGDVREGVMNFEIVSSSGSANTTHLPTRKICSITMMPLSAARRILFVLIQKGFKKIKFAVMQNNERLNQVGLKLAFARKRSNSKPP